MEVQSVLVTGGLGFVGSRIVTHIREKYPRCLITILDTRLRAVESEDPQIEHVHVDITSLSSVVEAFIAVRPQVVIHSAALVPPLSERYGRRIQKLVTAVNVDGTRNVLQAAQKSGVKAFVYTSSCTAVTDDFTQPYANIDERWPTVEPGKASIYGESKAQAEQLVHAANTKVDDSPKPSLRTCSLRLAVAFGEGDCQFLPSIISLIRGRNESPYRLGDGLNMWDVVYVGNAADAHVLALENLLSDNPTAAGEVFFIQNNEPVSVRDLMLFIWNSFNGHVPPFEVRIPVSLGWLVGSVAELYAWLTRNPSTLSRGSVLDATSMRYASGDKARHVLGYEPKIGLEEGLRRSCLEYATRIHSDKTGLNDGLSRQHYQRT